MRRLTLALVFVLTICRPSQAAFTHVTGQSIYSYTNAAAATSFTVSLPNNPTAGNLVCVASIWYNGGTSNPGVVAIKDGSLNVYQLSPSSPVINIAAGDGTAILAYLVVPAGASKAITITTVNNIGSSGVITLWVGEFNDSSGTPGFYQDAVGTDSGTPSVTVSTPTIPVSGTANLLFALCIPDTTIVSANGVWTALVASGAGSLPNVGGPGDAAVYDLSASSATALNLTQNTSGNWGSIGMSFTPTSAAVTCPQTLRLLGVGC